MGLLLGTQGAASVLSAAPTYNGVDLVLVRSETGGASAATFEYVYPGEPPVGAHNLVLTGTSVYADAAFFLVSVNGANSTTALPSSGATATHAGHNNGFQASPCSDSITVPSGGMAIDTVFMTDYTTAFVAGSGQTELAAQLAISTDGNYRMGASYKVDATAMSWTFTGASRQAGHSVMVFAPVAAGGGGVTATASWTEGSELIAIAALASGGTSSTLTTRQIVNNTGFVRVNQANCAINIYNATTGALVLRQTGLTSNSTGRLVITNAALTPGTSYAYEFDLTAASMGRRLPVASAA